MALANDYFYCMRELEIHAYSEYTIGEIKKKYVNDIVRYKELLANGRSLANYSFFEESKVKNIKESFIPEEHDKFVNNLVYDTYNGLRHNLERIDYQEAAALWDYEDPLLEAIDVLSLVTSPFGIDVVFDIFGASYCLVKGNTECFALYSAGVTLVGVSGGSVKLAKEALGKLGQLASRLTAKSNFANAFGVTTKEFTEFLKLEGAEAIYDNPECLIRLSFLEDSKSKKPYLDQLVYFPPVQN